MWGDIKKYDGYWYIQYHVVWSRSASFTIVLRSKLEIHTWRDSKNFLKMMAHSMWTVRFKNQIHFLPNPELMPIYPMMSFWLICMKFGNKGLERVLTKNVFKDFQLINPFLYSPSMNLTSNWFDDVSLPISSVTTQNLLWLLWKLFL